MSICIVVLENSRKANEICQKLQAASVPLAKRHLIRPKGLNQSLESIENQNKRQKDELNSLEIEPIDLDQVKLLNPKLGRKLRQRTMAIWLGPFGFITGISFTQMTGLTTFSDLGLGALGETFTGGLLGLGAGLIGSYFASTSVSSLPDEDIQSIIKLSQKGFWLLFLETPFEVELPWSLLKDSNPIDLVRLINQ